jgi:centromeric protein E
MAQSPRKRSAAAQHGAETTINVSVRIRPMNDMEVAMKSEPVWIEHHGNCITEIDTGGETGKQLFYDQVFGPETSTQEVYDKVAVNIIKASLAGYNGTLFAYGQTSSGKTHTLMGSAGEPGFIILAVHDVFNHILTTTNLEFLVRVSYVEIYNDELKDLLQPGQHDLRIVEDKDKGTCVQGMKEVVVTSPEQVLELIAEGESNRHYGETNMNANSSRSHTLFKMVLEMRDVLPHDAAAPEPKRRPDVRWSSIFIVDLAGSERVSKTRASGARLKEGNMINRSLLVLGTVISQLSKGGGGHIPFRDCKLTRLLQTSLGGNARTALVSAVSPAERNRAETISTLQFASRAKTVVNKAKINQLAEEKSLLSKYRNEIQLLKQQLEAQAAETPDVLELEAQNSALQEKADHDEAKATELGDRLQKMQDLVMVSTNLQTNSHLGRKAAAHIQKNLQDVVQNRRRLDSVMTETLNIERISALASDPKRARLMSVKSVGLLDKITSARHRKLSALGEGNGSESSDDSDSSSSSDSDSSNDQRPRRLSRKMSRKLEVDISVKDEQLQMLLEDLGETRMVSWHSAQDRNRAEDELFAIQGSTKKLQNDVSQEQSEKAVLVLKVRDAESQVANLEHRNSQVASVTNELDGRVRELSKERERLLDTIASMESNSAIQTDDVAQQHNQNQSLRAECCELQKQVEAQLEIQTSLEKQLNELIEVGANTSMDLKAANQLADQQSQDLKSTNQLADNQSQQCRHLEQELGLTQAENVSLASDLKNKAQQLLSSKQEYDALRNDFAAAQKQAANLQDSSELKIAQLNEDLQAELDANAQLVSSNTAKEQECQQLQNDYKATCEKLNQAEATVTGLVEDAAAGQQHASTLEQQLKQSDGQVHNFERTVKKLQADAEEMSLLSEQAEESQTALHHRTQELEGEVETLGRRHTNSVAEVKACKSALGSLRHELTSETDRSTTLQQSLWAEQEKASSLERENARELSHVKKALGTCESRLAGTQAKYADVVEQFDLVVAEKTTMSEENAAAQRKMLAEAKQSTRDVTVLRSKLEKETASVSEFRQDLDSITENEAQSKVEIQRLSNELSTSQVSPN